MYKWPDHFPAQCPPAHSTETSGSLFRFINGRTPAARDFLSHYERDPSGNFEHDPCLARGLSVLKTYEDCNVMRKGIPALRKKQIATGAPQGSSGLLAATPSRTCNGHCTWWSGITPTDAVSIFKTFLEPKGD